nr:fibropellin-1-like [Pocillopora verrucosa]
MLLFPHGDDSYCCECTDGYEGQNCEEVLPCPPAKKTDDPKGRCCGFPFVYKGITYQSCTKVGYHRLWCSLDEGEYKGQWANCVNPCTDNPCQNGGVCTVTGDDSYSCECADGYDGQNCEQGSRINLIACTFPPVQVDVYPQPNSVSCVRPVPECITLAFKAYFWYKLEEMAKYPCFKHDEFAFARQKSEGCFTEHKKKAKMVLKRKIATVGGKKLSIQDVFDECKSAAEKKGFKIFGIRNRNKCFTTSDGKVQEFKKYGVSSKCKIDDNGLGVGMKLANFVYTRP